MFHDNVVEAYTCAGNPNQKLAHERLLDPDALVRPDEHAEGRAWHPRRRARPIGAAHFQGGSDDLDCPDRLRGVFASRGEVAEAGPLLRLPTVIDTQVIWRSSDLHSDARVQFEVGGTR